MQEIAWLPVLRADLVAGTPESDVSSRSLACSRHHLLVNLGNGRPLQATTLLLTQRADRVYPGAPYRGCENGDATYHKQDSQHSAKDRNVDAMNSI